MEKRNISSSDILKLQVSTYGAMEVLRYYQRQMNSAVSKLKTAISDQNPMLMAEAAGLIAELNSKMSDLVMESTNAQTLDKTVV